MSLISTTTTTIFVLFFLTTNLNLVLLYNDFKETNNYKYITNEYLKQAMLNSPCNIPIETKPISENEFLQKYAYNSPVIFRYNRDEISYRRNELFSIKCQIDNLISQYGSKYVTISTANTYSYKKIKMRFDEYIEQQVNNKQEKDYLRQFGNETLYFFGDNNYKEWSELFESYDKPEYNLPMHEHAYSFGVAGSGSGVPWHFHGPGFAETIHGRKRWFLYEPNTKPIYDPDKSTLQWLIEEYPKIKEDNMPMECILEPFDFIYFPDRWWHATLNIDTAVFISTFLSQTFKKSEL